MKRIGWLVRYDVWKRCEELARARCHLTADAEGSDTNPSSAVLPSTLLLRCVVLHTYPLLGLECARQRQGGRSKKEKMVGAVDQAGTLRVHAQQGTRHSHLTFSRAFREWLSQLSSSGAARCGDLPPLCAKRAPQRAVCRRQPHRRATASHREATKAVTAGA